MLAKCYLLTIVAQHVSNTYYPIDIIIFKIRLTFIIVDNDSIFNIVVSYSNKVSMFHMNAFVNEINLSIEFLCNRKIGDEPNIIVIRTTR